MYMINVSKCQREDQSSLSYSMFCMGVAIVDRWWLKGGGCARSMNQVVMCSGIFQRRYQRTWLLRFCAGGIWGISGSRGIWGGDIYFSDITSVHGSLATVNLKWTFRLGILTCDLYQCDVMEMASTFGGIQCCNSSTWCRWLITVCAFGGGVDR